MDSRRLDELLEKLAEAKEARAKAQGALEPLMKTLKEDFGCETLEEAEKKLKELGDSIKKMETSFEEKLEEAESLIEG